MTDTERVREIIFESTEERVFAPDEISNIWDLPGKIIGLEKPEYVESSKSSAIPGYRNVHFQGLNPTKTYRPDVIDGKLALVEVFPDEIEEED